MPTPKKTAPPPPQKISVRIQLSAALDEQIKKAAEASGVPKPSLIGLCVMAGFKQIGEGFFKAGEIKPLPSR
jgi:hypothetical protein